MRIAFFVNDFEREQAGYTTTVLAHQAAMRGHERIPTDHQFVARNHQARHVVAILDHGCETRVDLCVAAD